MNGNPDTTTGVSSFCCNLFFRNGMLFLLFFLNFLLVKAEMAEYRTQAGWFERHPGYLATGVARNICAVICSFAFLELFERDPAVRATHRSIFQSFEREKFLFSGRENKGHFASAAINDFVFQDHFPSFGWACFAGGS